jgi:hypothetical protein
MSIPWNPLKKSLIPSGMSGIPADLLCGHSLHFAGKKNHT